MSEQQTCCVGTCENRAVVSIRFAPHGVQSFLYCRYHGRNRDGSDWRWQPWAILSVEVLR